MKLEFKNFTNIIKDNLMKYILAFSFIILNILRRYNSYISVHLRLFLYSNLINIELNDILICCDNFLSVKFT